MTDTDRQTRTQVHSIYRACIASRSKKFIAESASDFFLNRQIFDKLTSKNMIVLADDLVLLAPTASALRKMLAICDVYAAEYSVSFNAQKSKCLVILSNACRYLRPLLQDNVFYVDGKPIDFVSSFTHLGLRLPS